MSYIINSYLIDYFQKFVVFTTILQMLSGILVCKQYVKNNSTGEASPLPFIFGAISCTLWLCYGHLKNDSNVMFVNIVGLALMMLYTLVFYRLTVQKSMVSRLVLITICTMAILFLYIGVADDYVLLQNQVGFLACAMTLLTVAAPMSKFLYVLRVKNVECLPFPMILMSFIVSTLWLMYGITKDDMFMVLPNFLAATLGVFQLMLFLVYPSKPLPAHGSAKTLLA